MKLYDLEAFTRNKRPDAGAPQEEIVRTDVKFKVVVDEEIIPPLEVLEGFADRELILARQRVISQKRIDHPPILSRIQESLAANGGGKEPSPDATNAEPCDVEYEDQGTLPEGAFMFRGHVAFLHVDKRGRIKQIDLVKKRDGSRQLEQPVNKEFKNMLIQDIKEHEWDELAALFLKNH